MTSVSSLACCSRWSMPFCQWGGSSAVCCNRLKIQQVSSTAISSGGKRTIIITSSRRPRQPAEDAARPQRAMESRRPALCAADPLTGGGLAELSPAPTIR